LLFIDKKTYSIVEVVAKINNKKSKINVTKTKLKSMLKNNILRNKKQ